MELIVVDHAGKTPVANWSQAGAKGNPGIHGELAGQ